MRIVLTSEMDNITILLEGIQTINPPRSYQLLLHRYWYLIGQFEYIGVLIAQNVVCACKFIVIY